MDMVSPSEMQLGLLDELAPEFRDPSVIPDVEKPALAVLSYGCGQDSFTLLLKYLHDENFRERYAPLGFLVVMAETGDEHPHTMKHLDYTKELCAKEGVEFHHITPDLGFHSPGWQGLRQFYRAHNACGSKAFPKTCTHRLKLQPIYRFIEDWLGQKYGVSVGRKKGFLEFARRYGKIRVMIGIAAGEERRIADPTTEVAAWKRSTVESVYPLVDLGLDRRLCQEYMRGTGHPVPYPSNCILCPFASDVELLWLSRFLPADYEDWVDIERNKLAAFAHLGDRNLGVWGRKALPDVLAEAREKYAGMTDADLNEYKFSHGHCVMSKY